MSEYKQLTIKEIYDQDKLSITYEVFPPKKESDIDGLLAELKKLMEFDPQFISVTYGAGGSTQERSTKSIEAIMSSCSVNVVPHFTCIGSSGESVLVFLEKLKSLNIRNILALRGDPPKEDLNYKPAFDSFKYANELVSFIKKNSNLDIAVAGYPDVHPEAKSAEEDMTNLKRKVDSGASAVITQLFYDNNSYYRFVEKAKKAGINVPFIPGIMPLTRYSLIENMIKFCKAVIPEEYMKKMNANKDNKEYLKAMGIEYSINQIKELLKFGIKGLHMYTLNKAEITSAILKSIL